MSRARVAVLKVVSKQASAGEVAAEYGFSRRHLQRLRARYREGGLEALEPRSRRPRTTPNATPEPIQARVVELRVQLTAAGFELDGRDVAQWVSDRLASALRDEARASL